MSAERGETLPLILSTSSSQFPQQGQVDWSSLGKNTVEFTVDVLSRLSKAGIEALTVYAAKVLFSHAKLDQLGEQRILDALKAVKAFSSHSNVVWFGFGIKNILRSLSETQQGIACIGICSCLTEEFSTEKSAQILGELFQLYNPPADLRPSLRQWHAIVSSCEGVVTTTNFGFVLSGLARICLLDGHNGLCTSSKPKDLAHVLKGLFDVSNGTLDKIHISGGSDCAWIAAVGHWLFGLQVVVEDASGNIIYRPGGIRSATRHDPQVVLSYSTVGPQSPGTSAITQKSYSLSSGRFLVDMVLGSLPEGDLLSHGRLDWSTCLLDAFGQSMKSLLTSFAPQTAKCLGSAARIYESRICDFDEELNEELNEGCSVRRLVCTPGSFGRGFWIHARQQFPELRNAPGLIKTMERHQEQSLDLAIQSFLESINSLATICRCQDCKNDSAGKGLSSDESTTRQKPLCLVRLIYVLCSLIQLSSQIIFQKDLVVCPTLNGMNRLYMMTRPTMPSTEDFGNTTQISWLALLSIPFQFTDLHTMGLLFNGRVDFDPLDFAQKHTCASAADGVCIYLNSVCEISSDPQRACLIHIVPGRIEWNNFSYHRVVGSIKGPYRHESSAMTRWPCTGATSITTYDKLKDTSSQNLEACLIVVEESISTNTILAKWRISSPSGFWVLDPAEIHLRLQAAFCGKICDDKGCGSLKGLKSTLVEGDGFLNGEALGIDGTSFMYGPLVRVFPGNPLAVWLALSQGTFTCTDNIIVHQEALLQGKQCIRCCIINTMKRSHVDDDEAAELNISLAGVSIITNPSFAS